MRDWISDGFSSDLPDIGVKHTKEGLGDRQPRHYNGIAALHHAIKTCIGRDHCGRGDVAPFPQVFGKRVSNEWVQVEARHGKVSHRSPSACPHRPAPPCRRTSPASARAASAPSAACPRRSRSAASGRAGVNTGTGGEGGGGRGGEYG